MVEFIENFKCFSLWPMAINMQDLSNSLIRRAPSQAELPSSTQTRLLRALVLFGIAQLWQLAANKDKLVRLEQNIT